MADPTNPAAPAHGVCEYCYTPRPDPDDGWGFIWQSHVCPECRKRVRRDGGYCLVKCGAYAIGPDPRAKQPAAPAVDPREVCARVCEARHSTLTRTDEALEAIKCAAAIRALPPFAAQALSGTEIAVLWSAAVVKAARDMTTAEYQFARMIEARGAVAAQQPSKAVQRLVEAGRAVCDQFDHDAEMVGAQGGYGYLPEPEQIKALRSTLAALAAIAAVEGEVRP